MTDPIERDPGPPSRDIPARDPRNKPLDTAPSPRIETPKKRLTSGNDEALSLSEFWQSVEEERTPLVEEIPGAPEYSWCDDETGSVLVNADKFTDSEVLEQGLMRRLESSGDDIVFEPEEWNGFRAPSIPYVLNDDANAETIGTKRRHE